MAQTFSALKVLHERLDELFLLHQESLLDQTGDGGEWADRSLALLDRYEAALREHLRLEEELLLPVYRRAGKIPGGAGRVLHRRARPTADNSRPLSGPAARTPPWGARAPAGHDQAL
ncbi:MAG: hemerythrin domain-containing protein [Acidobacteriota bacterium]